MSISLFDRKTEHVLRYALHYGLTANDAAFLLQVHPDTIYKWAKRCGIRMPGRFPPGAKKPTEHRVRLDQSLVKIPVAISMAKAGAPDHDIAKAIDRSVNWVRINISRARTTGERLPYQVARRAAAAEMSL